MSFSDSVLLAAAHIAPHVRVTPAMQVSARALGITGDCDLWLKLEHLQVGGSFKARGAFNRMLSQRVPDAGVTIASGGNAGIATAYAARELGHRAEIFLPEVASQAKRDKLKALGATVHVEGKVYGEALEACIAHQRTTGALMMHAYDQPEVVEGAGTLGREICEQTKPDSILVSVGGGGLIAGISNWVLSVSPQSNAISVIAVEPTAAPTLNATLAAGEMVDVAVGGIAADSLGATRLGTLAWQARAGITQSLLVSDISIRHAQLTLWSELRLAVEPAAAVPLAALQSGLYKPRSRERVCLVICGANVDLSMLAHT
jgi:threonine dehydratase